MAGLRIFRGTGDLYTTEGRDLKRLNRMDSVTFKGMVFQIENRMKAPFRPEGVRPPQPKSAVKCDIGIGARLIIILLLAVNYYIIINRPRAVFWAVLEAPHVL